MVLEDSVRLVAPISSFDGGLYLGPIGAVLLGLELGFRFSLVVGSVESSEDGSRPSSQGCSRTVLCVIVFISDKLTIMLLVSVFSLEADLEGFFHSYNGIVRWCCNLVSPVVVCAMWKLYAPCIQGLMAFFSRTRGNRWAFPLRSRLLGPSLLRFLLLL
ncbi:hypothetical protein F2Q70_00016526 [Brassica cretica]|uniref:Uncharacterized protein n=1 Tax=Brassica cretica TaxID=69181 RepID=A0A8S9KX28_BRACR|nr:hypothetical protein F2Q70_00016526 [Brassica cretica]KAF2599085.1 hypothetical protein F2Q68_00009484 [Brassica cretica]